MQKNKRNSLRNYYFSEELKACMLTMSQCPLTIVEAPMGYGKTTLVRELFNTSPYFLLWQRVYDDSQSSFWIGFCRLFRTLDPVAMETLLQLQLPNDGVSRTIALEILENIQWPSQAIMVIDDYHLIECELINQWMLALVEREWQGFKLIITTRYTQFPKFEQLKAQGKACHLQKEMLEWQPDAILAYYKQCGYVIKQSEAQQLYQLTEGWISALYLLLLDYKIGDAIGGIQNIYTLIDKVLFAPLTDEQKEVLMTLSIFNRFTINQGQFMMPHLEVEKIVTELVSKNGFVSTDLQEKTYTIHSIFNVFLLEKRELLDENLKQMINHQAARWYLEIKEPLEALPFAYKANDFESVLQAVVMDKGFGLNNEYKEQLIHYFQQCPQEIKKKYPIALLVYARRLFSFNERALFQSTCAEFLEIYNTLDQLDAHEKNNLMGEFQLLLSFTGYNDIEKMSLYHQKACQLLTEPSVIMENTGSWTFGSPSVLYMFYRKSGTLAKTVQIIEKAMPYYYQLTNKHGLGAEIIMAAETAYYTGNFRKATLLVEEAFHIANNNNQSGIAICAVFLKIKLNLMEHAYSSAGQLLEQMREHIQTRRWQLFMHTLDMCESYIYAYLDQKENITPWILQGDFKNTRILFPALGFLNMVYGKVLLIQGEYLKLIAMSESFNSVTAVFPNLLGQIYTTIYVAIAYSNIDRREEGLNTLKKGIEISAPDQLYMPYVENYRALQPLIVSLIAEQYEVEFLNQVDALAYNWHTDIKNSFHEMAKSKNDLTEKELEIARWVAKGLTNKEISEVLFVSPNTIKTQLKTIFEKCQIHSRALLKQYIESLDKK